jgi:steroid delta-isomerase-like uncharacterized protein
MSASRAAPVAAVAWIEAFASRWAAAWNGHDADRVLALMTPDVLVDDPSWPVLMRGRGGVRPYLEHAWRAFPDLRFTPRDRPLPADGGDCALLSWEATATHRGPIEGHGLAPTGRTVRFAGAELHDYRDGLLARRAVAFDVPALLAQLAPRREG